MSSQSKPETTPLESAPLEDVSQPLPKTQELRQSRLEKLLSPFRRVTSNGQYIPVIDGLRFVAIMMVVIYHLNDYIVHKKGLENDPTVRSSIAFQIFNAGNVGVQLFFAISGFILALPFIEKVQQGKPLGLKRYYLRRLTRLEPPYIINLTVVLILLIFWKGQSFSDLIGPYFASLFYVHNIIYGEMSRINGVAWSLEIEVQFYVLAPFLFKLLFSIRKSLRHTILLFVSAIGICENFIHPANLPAYWNLTLMSQFEYFLVGVLLADTYPPTRSPTKRSLTFDTLTAATFATIILTRHTALGNLTLAPAIYILITCSFRGIICNSVLSLPPFTTIGGACYSIYLYHFYAISLLMPTLATLTLPSDLVSIPILSLLFITLSMPPYILIERRFMALSPSSIIDSHPPSPQQPSCTAIPQTQNMERMGKIN